jgi:uracil-DNA glycosylase
MSKTTSLQTLNQQIIACRACPRLVTWREQVAREKRKAYRAWDYWGKPVPGFGDPHARVMVVGLAPGAHGSNRTGRQFTGDASGDFLYPALFRAGFANQPVAASCEDGLILTDLYITAAGRCAPPDNKPTPAELATCQPFLARELEIIQPKVIVALGRIAFDSILRILYPPVQKQTENERPKTEEKTARRPSSLVFSHGALFPLPNSALSIPNLSLLCSYHPSQQNTLTGKLTIEMFDAVWEKARQKLEGSRETSKHVPVYLFPCFPSYPSHPLVPKPMKRFLKITSITLLALLVLAALGFVIWAQNAAAPGEAALAALQSDARVTVTQTDAYIAFQPADLQSTTGFIFYPGGRVDYRAYAPVLRQIAEQGYLVALVPVRLNLAFFDIEAGAPALRDFPEITAWAVGGHSLGGVAASIFAANQPRMSGIIYWASYPADGTLKSAGMKTLSIYATNDGLATPETVQANKSLMPENSTFVAIEGGNHAQFGDYGAQDGDLPASIPAEAQWAQISRATSDFLQLLAP